MSLFAILVIILVLLALGAFPRAGAYSSNWGYGPSGFLGVIVVIIVIYLLLGRGGIL